MNETNGNISAEVLDRLVDGELPDGERRALIESLESEPEGWRRCALSFLEAQTWRDAAGEQIDEATAAVVAPLPQQRPRRFRANLVSLAVAVGIAFVCGWGMGTGWLVAEPVAQIADSSGGNEPALTPTETNEPQFVGLARFDTDDVDQPPIPVFTAAGADAEWLQQQPPPVSDYTRQVMERKGWHVQQDRRLMSVHLIDGREFAIPLDSVRVQYVGQRVY